MKKILVPTDFSKADESAAQHGASLAHRISAKLELVHVINAGESGKKRGNWKKLEVEMIRAARNGAKKRMAALKQPLKPAYSALVGYPFQQIISEYAVDEKFDLIVIGSRGASGVKKALLGSKAATLINGSPKPVIVVPGRVKFSGINNIVYATDMAHLDEEVKIVAKLAKPFDVVIVNVTDKTDNARDRTSLKNILSRMANHKKLRFEVIENENVAKGIAAFIAREKPDLLAMFTHELGFVDKLLGQGSLHFRILFPFWRSTEPKAQ